MFLCFILVILFFKLTLSPAHYHWDVKKIFLLFLLLFCVVRTQKIVWLRKKGSDPNFIICCSYATSSDKSTISDKNLELLVVYS